MKKHVSTILLILIFVIGLSLLLYPTVSDWWNSFHQSRVINSYVSAVDNLDDETYDRMLSDVADYNARLFAADAKLTLPADMEEEYESLLDLEGSGVMGYVIIDKINCQLPIYHGTSDSVLQVAVGHITGSSLPVGGESTHCVLSGHRGLPSAQLFSRLDQMEVGDTFLLQILDETLTYEVDQISIVLPSETDALQIVEGEDLCTLVTCTPYGVNTHRLLVRGHRVENAKSANIRVSSEATQFQAILIAPIFAAPMMAILLIWMLFHSRKKKRGESHEEGK